MAGSKNLKVVKEAFEKQLPKWYDTLEVKLQEFCERLLLDAVIRNREGNAEAHQFTGNLINSIVVILFRKDTGEQFSYFAYDRLKSPIRREMSAKTQRGTMRKRAIHFRPDWQNTPHSRYTPEVVTDESTGPSDARSFAASWMPTTGKAFEICVAYTSEYATFVEQHRHTTGYLNSISYTRAALRGQGFKHVSG